jgi:hypothetical protein
MPTYKPKLTHREQARYLEVAQDLAAAGERIDIPPEWIEEACCLRLTIAPSPGSMIYQLSPSTVLYVFRLRLFAERTVAVQDFEVAATWDPDIFPCYSNDRQLYRFAPGLDFDSTEVLNHRIDEVLRFRRGDVREGWLLAMGNRPVPEGYGPGMPAPVQVRLSAPCCRMLDRVDLFVERSAKAKQSNTGVRTGLFEPRSEPRTERSAVDVTLPVPLSVNPFRKVEQK